MTVALISAITVFVLAVFVGFEIITRVPPTLHTPLMSGSNAISGITIVGAIVVLAAGHTGAARWLGMAALMMATINVCPQSCSSWACASFPRHGPPPRAT